jgi:predicted component of type VI protein secretion system
MARLILSLDGQVLAEYNMSKERYTIGRLPDNDVRIDNPAVSGHHSLIINILNDSFLEDLNSTNGTYVNGRLIKKHALQHGDTITIGHHQLRFVDQQSDSAQDEFEKTMVIHPSTQSKRSLDRVQQAVEEASAAASPPPPPPPMAAAVGAPARPPAPAAQEARLQVLSGQFAGRELNLTKALTTLGRPGVQVAAITRRSEGFYLVHVDGGPSGQMPEINGSAIGEKAQKLADSDVIQIAGVKMGFFAGAA